MNRKSKKKWNNNYRSKSKIVKRINSKNNMMILEITIINNNKWTRKTNGSESIKKIMPPKCGIYNMIMIMIMIFNIYI